MQIFNLTKQAGASERALLHGLVCLCRNNKRPEARDQTKKLTYGIVFLVMSPSRREKNRGFRQS